MQTFVKNCKPGSAFALLKLSQSSIMLNASRQTAAAASVTRPASLRTFSDYKPRRNSRSPGRQRKNSRSPGRSPDARGVHPPQHYHERMPRFVQESHEVPAEEVDTNARSVFAHDSTFTLVKKLMIYKMMGSNIFINYSLMGINMAYKVFGTRLTNSLIESTASSVFTGGVTVADLMESSKSFSKREIGTIGCYVVEGVREAENEHLDQFYDFSVESVQAVTEGAKEGHFALKLTAYISTDVMEKVSQAQDRFANEVLQIRNDSSEDSVLTEAQLTQNLASIGVTEFER